MGFQPHSRLAAHQGGAPLHDDDAGGRAFPVLHFAPEGDILEMLAWTKGKRGLVEGPGNTPIGVRSGDAVEAAKAMARATKKTVHVVGGQVDETAAQATAEAFAAARERKHWEQTTGSAKGAIDWWMSEEA